MTNSSIQTTWLRSLLNTLDRKIYVGLTGKREGPSPDEIKRGIIKGYAEKFKLKIFVETGTYLGGTVDFLKDQFEKIVTVELDKNLYSKAVEKFRNYSHITLLQGDSGVLMESIVENYHEPVLFFLDGHYSGGVTAKGNVDTPIMQELKVILNHKVKNHVILIDDARCFIGENGYPIIKDIQSLLQKQNKNMYLSVESDIIRIIPLDELEQQNLPTHKEPWRYTLGRAYRQLKRTFKKVIGYRSQT
jgi:hypothetical protein